MSATTVLLSIPPRLQWKHGNGFCGEVSIQSIALKFGAWISQGLIRKINKGEYLLQPVSSEDRRDPLQTLTQLHLTYDEWNWKDTPQPQFRQFCQWMKRSILRGHPVVFGIFLPDDDCDDYDHIVPAVGIKYENEDEHDPDHDKLIYYDLYELQQIEKGLNEKEFAATRASIDDKEDADDGCLPLNIDYGIAITGIVDKDGVTLPVHLSVSACDEQVPYFFPEPREMNGTVTVSGLLVGNFYALLRYSSYKHVPTGGDADAFLQSSYDEIHVFMAMESNYVYEDPKTIPSDGSVYYRCVIVPE
ncbi:unnamed protein product [Adineta ricciae]|uniref:Peptidase C39-like domain-containing protein n=2 Tax=Adineta ricciae TaxID=249248 RepID=A0A815CHZ3_ADIRI|nr:unnamed protein product [Adineta ricciae]